MLGCISYGKLKKAVHHVAVQQELQYRGLHPWDAHNANFTECKKKLKDMEVLRLANSIPSLKASAYKGFQPQSAVVFQMI